MLRSASAFALLFTALLLAPTAAGQQAACENGFAASFSCEGINLLSNVPLSQLGNSGFANDLWGWTDAQTGREYALVGLFEGTAFVDITNPTSPLYLGRLPSHTNGSTWRDIKVYDDHAFIVSEAGGHGMQVFDLTQLRGVVAPTSWTETTHYNGTGSAHNIVINEDTGFAYIVGASGGSQSGCSGGLHMVDIQNPTSPSFAGCFSQDGYTHDAQCVVYDGPDADYTGQEICFASNEDTVTIVDVTDKTNPIQLSQAVYPNTAYTHQGWLTENQRYFLANDEIDELNFGFGTRTLIFDVEDLDEPEFFIGYSHGNPATDHNLYNHRGITFQANYRSGLRVLDFRPLLNGTGPVQRLGFFDTNAPGATVGTSGAWSVYPFFESGTVIVSDTNNGLLILDPQLPGNPTDSTTDTAPGTFALGQPYPNPTSSRTQFDLQLGESQRVDVAVYDVLGRRVADLFAGSLAADQPRTFSFDTASLPAGLYFVRVSGETFSETRQVSVTR